MALSQNSLNNGARWGVVWLGARGIVEKKFGEDFSGALDAYTTLRSAGKKLVTLRCLNVGFPPPKHITEHEEISYKIVRIRGKRYKKQVVNVVNLMSEHNAEGNYWCPYCIKLRPFKTVKEKRQILMVCPVCKITSRDFHVRMHNPKVLTISMRRTRGRRTVRRRSRRH